MLMLWIVCTLIAYFIKGLCGFAETLVLTTLMALLGASNVAITPVAVLMSCPANMFMAWQLRKSVRLKAVLPLLCALIAGMVPGIFFLKSINA